MRKNVAAHSLLRTWLRNLDGRSDGGGYLPSVELQILRSRRIASDAGGGSAGAKPPIDDDEQEDKKTDLGRWWQTFSEQTRTQEGNQRKTSRESGGIRWSIPKGEQLAEQQLQESSSREGGPNRWFMPKREQLSDQEQPESFNKETISKWLLPKDKEGSSTEQERQEITSKQVGARWLASAREKSSTDQELSDLSNIPWVGLSKQTPAAERERREVSMQRLALMSKPGDKDQAPSFMFLPPKDQLLRKYFHWDNLASPEKHKVTLTKVRQDFQIHKTDCGSSQVQIALLTTKIKYMTQHMQTHKKDYHSRKGLEAMVQRRRKILKYLRRTDWDAYCDVITKLGLRDNVMEPQKR